METEERYEKRKSLTQMVVKDNRLIQNARFNLTATQQKFLAYVISKIKPTDDGLKEYEIRVEDFCHLCGIDKTWFYTEFIKLVEEFDSKSFWIENEKELYKFRWFDDTSYQKGKGQIKVTLSKRLREYLIGLTKEFTQYELYNIMALKSKYAIRLFELFKSYAYQRQRDFDIEELKEILYATNYKNFADFKKRVLEPSVKEINEYTELKVEYLPIQKGKKIIQVRFIIGRKELVESYISYRKTIEQINKDNNQIQGQMNIEDYFV